MFYLAISIVFFSTCKKILQKLENDLVHYIRKFGSIEFLNESAMFAIVENAQLIFIFVRSRVRSRVFNRLVLTV